MGSNVGRLEGSSVQLVMLGLDSAGKSTILYRMKFDHYMNTVPTIGFNCEKVRSTAGKSKGVTFVIWDVGGQDKTRPLWRSYTRSADGVIFVIDSVDRERIEEARIELFKLAKCQDIGHVPILVIANKQDLPRSLDVSELEKLLTLHEMPQSQLCHVQPACAVTGEGLQEAMDKMYEMINKRKKQIKKNKGKR